MNKSAATPLQTRMQAKGFLTVADLTARTGVPQLTFYRLINLGKVRATKVSKFWFVEVASLVKHLGPEASKLLGLESPKPLLPPEK